MITGRIDSIHIQIPSNLVSVGLECGIHNDRAWAFLSLSHKFQQSRFKAPSKTYNRMTWEGKRLSYHSKSFGMDQIRLDQIPLRMEPQLCRSIRLHFLLIDFFLGHYRKTNTGVHDRQNYSYWTGKHISKAQSPLSGKDVNSICMLSSRWW